MICIRGGQIIPEEVEIKGTIRTKTYESMERIQGIMRERISGVAAANGCNSTVEFRGDVEYTNSRGEKVGWRERDRARNGNVEHRTIR